jgi:Type VI secretion system/phage-baseplate injector OB domain
MDYTGLYRGIVVDNVDPDGLMRVRVRLPQLMGENVSGWAYPVPTGIVTVPDVGSQVWVTFEGGDPSFPLYYALVGVENYTMAEADDRFLTQVEADALFLTPAEGDALFLTQAEADSLFLTQSEADALFLTQTEGDARYVQPSALPETSLGTATPASPLAGDTWYDTNNLTGLTDLLAAANPTTSTASWTAYGFGYDTGVSFATGGGATTITWNNANNHFAGINVTGLTAGESYLARIKVRVPAGSPDVALTVGYKTSGHPMRIKDQDVTLLLAFVADGTSAAFGVEAGGATGTCIVKQFNLYTVNQRGYPEYYYDGTGWHETLSVAQKGDLYSRVNTFGDQTVGGVKAFTSGIRTGGGSNPAIITGSNNEATQQPVMEVYKNTEQPDTSSLLVIRGNSAGAGGSVAGNRSVGILLKHSSEANTGESNKGWEITAFSNLTYGNTPSLVLRNGNTGRNALVLNGGDDDATFSGYNLTVGRGGTTADQAQLILAGADAGAGGGGAGILFQKNGSSKWQLYTLGSGDGNLYVRDLANAKMVATFSPGGAGASQVSVTDTLTVGGNSNLNGSLVNVAGTLDFSEALGDRLMLYGLANATTAYGLGIESGAMYFKSNGLYRWYIVANADGGASSKMALGTSGLVVAGNIQATSMSYLTSGTVTCNAAANVTVTLPASKFAAAPNVVATARNNTFTATNGRIVVVGNESATSFTVFCVNIANGGTVTGNASTVNWIATTF